MEQHFSIDVDRLALPAERSALSPLGQLPSGLECSACLHSPSREEVDRISSEISTNAAHSSNVVPVETDASISLQLCVPSNRAVFECRICQEEEDVTKLETPCACSGSVKYAHRICVQRWCNEKGDTTCEICCQPYRGGYTARGQLQQESVSIDLSDEWGVPGAHPMYIRDPRILAIAAAQRRFLEAEYEESAAVSFSTAACLRSAALMLMLFILLRHALAIIAANAHEDAPTFYTIFILRVAGLFLPCYIMVRVMNMLERRHNSQAAAIAAAEMTVLLQAGHPRGSRVSLAPAINDLP